MAGLKEWARRGAEARVTELRAELAAIYRVFPALRGGGAQGSRVAIGIAPVKPRRRKPMSAAQRKAVGIRMKAYWAARRKSSK
jgi:hypothetical protein